MVTQRHPKFRFHPLCKRIELSHLCFADDLILFCKGERASIELLLQAFNFFSKASGLKMNKGKSNYYCNGMDDWLVNEIGRAIGMKLGAVPFKYLGVTVSPKRLSILDCTRLVDNVVDRIRGMGAKHLSYAGRLVLIRVVLSTLHNYWARIFILPKTVLKKIDSICREYLWHGHQDSSSPALVAWDRVCRPKRQRGSGLHNLMIWNMAAVAKYVWWIATKADHLWVKWVHAIYIKDRNWKDYEPTSNSSWAWRKICQIKSIFKELLLPGSGVTAYYSTALGYKWLQGQDNVCEWYPWILNTWVVPKHGFISWLMGHNRLLTQDRLMNMKIIQSNLCYLCGLQQENHSHLFFKCEYSRRCCSMVAAWCDEMLPDEECIQWWCHKRYMSLSKKRIVGVILAGLIYHLWMARNKCRVEQAVIHPEQLVKFVQADVCNRVKKFQTKCQTANVKNWLDAFVK
ncbi:uncharacterized protein LOC141632644 [Silene latifolia]|uniref:uncharacterized protein LOC141632644 n=1 Tax=Silene latifolia TaxID=37657 RepID=UPI003D773A7D